MPLFCFGRSRSPPEEKELKAPPVNYEHNHAPIEAAEGMPMRLTPAERKVERLIRGIMAASCYTDKVDVEALANDKVKRQHVIAMEIWNALVGFIVALDFRAGAEMMASRDVKAQEQVIVAAIEASRRFKIMNPDLLRTDYAKFLYMVQDAVQPEMVELLGFRAVKPVRTVRRYLAGIKAEEILSDDRLPLAVTPVPKIKDRNSLNRALRYKDQLVDKLCAEWGRKCGVGADKVEVAVRSLNDANCFSTDNVDSTVELIGLLTKFFSAEAPADPSCNLAIQAGLEGSRLTHEHKMQFTFVLQSLTLWKNISSRMFELWTIAEDDMLDSTHPYELRNTGQGLQRVQTSPNLHKAVSQVLDATKKELGQWVGSDKIHLGDNQVPNAFTFIDKYAQISRIIIPVLRTISTVPTLSEKDPHKSAYITEVWGSVEAAQRCILADFFRHGFDGSGGDNMEDAGSCIDGRLTSAWNWCNSIRSKPYYPLFLFAGFTTFDGDLSL